MYHSKVCAVASRHLFLQVAIIDLSVACLLEAYGIEPVEHLRVAGWGTLRHYRIMPAYCRSPVFDWRGIVQVESCDDPPWQWVGANFDALSRDALSPWYWRASGMVDLDERRGEELRIVA